MVGFGQKKMRSHLWPHPIVMSLCPDTTISHPVSADGAFILKREVRIPEYSVGNLD